MEVILENLSMDATAGKLKAITDACDEGLEALSKERIGRPVEPYELREKCLLPLKLALESRVSKLSSHALGGFHKLISDERFQSLVEGDVHRQLAVQFVNAVVSTPSMSDEIQVEIMKMLLMITCSASCEVHGEYLIKIAEVCIETHTRSSQSWTKTACRATLTQMLNSVCNDLEESLKKEMLSQHSKEMPHSVRGLDLITTDSSKILTQDVLMLMKHFCSRLSPNQSGNVQVNDALPLYLEAVVVIVSTLSVAIRQEKDFINVLWQYLCPTLIHLLGSPVSDVGSKPKGHNNHPEDGGRGGRSAGSPLKPKPVLQSVARIIYTISKELVRLVGPLNVMRPVLESLFHRIILYPPPQHRSEALKAITDIFASPTHVVDIAGPVVLDSDNPPSPESPTEQKKSEVDLLKVLLDGIAECSRCSELSVVGGSVACIVALLDSLEELSQGEGLSQEQVELLSKLEDVDGWENVEEKHYNKAPHDSPRTIPKFTVADEPFDEGEQTDAINIGKSKHIRWEMDEEELRVTPGDKQMQLSLDQMDLEAVTQKFASGDRLWDISRTNPDGKEQDVSDESGLLGQAKSVHFATDLEEEFTIESREDQRMGRFGNVHRAGVPRRSGLPRRIASSPNRSAVRRSASLDGKSKSRPVVQVKNARNDRDKHRASVQRSNSDLGTSPPDEHESIGNSGDIFDDEPGHNDNVADSSRILRPRVSRSILRKSKPSSESPELVEFIGKPTKPKGMLLNSHLGDPASKKHGVVKINGILISRLRDSRVQTSPEKIVSGPRKVIEKRKSVEENEKEGARNFARCLLGILPSVLSLHDPMAVDEALQQFASDVCEAVTCMALKRKNVPNFGTLRGSSDLLDDTSGKGATSYLHYPILNADGVYAAVYATLKLNLKLHRAGYYGKKQEQELVTQEEFIQNTHNCGVDVGLSSVWLGELHRLVTTYDILEKAGYKADDVSSNRALIELLSDNCRITRNNEEIKTDETMFIRVQNQASMTVTQKQGVKFVRRILLLTWDSLLEVLRVPIESPLIGTVNESIGMAMMIASEGTKHGNNKERDTVCLSLDGLRRIARLFCTLGIQTGCETVLSQLANASCGGEKGLASIPKVKGGHSKNRMKLHAAHVLTMDALLAVGLELGSHAPKCWKHVFRCCSYIAGLQNTQFSAGASSAHSSYKVAEVSSPVSEASSASDFIGADLSSDGSVSDILRQHHDETSDATGVLNAADASRAIYALSISVDRLFEQAANTLSSDAMVAMLVSLADASLDQLEKQYDRELSCDLRVITLADRPLPSNLHFCRMVDMLLRCTRDGKRPLLHLTRAWATVSEHFVKVSCDNTKIIFKFTLDLIKETLVVLLNNRNELPHFWFHETLFKPFERILLSGAINETDQEEVLSVLCELVKTNVGNIKSGWRAICCSTRALHIPTRPNTTEQDISIPKILEILSSFVENKTALVFSQGAVDCILCLSTCLHVQPGGDDVSDDRSTHDSETESNISETPYGDMCLPALELLSKISKKLALIYTKPANVIFHGSHAVKLDNSSSPLSSPSSPLMSVSDTVKPQENNVAPTYAHSVTAMDDSGILRVWYLLLDVLTTTAITCPRKFQLQALDTLFEVLHSVCSVPGPQFSILALTHLLLPMLHTWLDKGRHNATYWDQTTGNFKQACGLTTELIVAEMGHFLSDQGASECVPTLMKQVLDLLKSAVSQPEEVIARVGCSCFRHLLMSGGALFTEEIWRIICEGLQDAMRATLSPVKLLIPCYQVGSNSVSGDDGYRVRVLTRRDASWEQTIRHGQLAEQVFLLESQLQEEFDRNNDELPTNEDDGQRSFFFVISSADCQGNAEETTSSRVPLRGLVIGLLSHQLLLQSLGLLLLDNRDNSFPILNNPPSTPDDQLDSSMPGLLSYLSPANLSIIFDCLMESHTVAYEFNNRFGLRSLIQMIVRLCAPANLLRQSTMAFTFYLQTLLEICRYNGEHMSRSSVQRILIGDRSMSPGGDSTQSSGLLSSEGDAHVTEDKDAEWIVRRLCEACTQLSSVYNRLYNNYNASDEAEGNLTSTPVSSPSKLRFHFGDESLSGGRRRVESPDILKSDTFCSRERQHLQLKKEDDFLQLKTWTAMAVDMIEALLELPTLQFKPILPAIYPAVTSMIPVTGDPKVCRLIYDVVMRVGSIYGII